ncbi:MAG: UDP-N-acetylglucosamine--N-acetylmuramyl-(pentapeptide) pyrophosphoryl-undecaprenol N-acetylglucosamine transferase, partial [Candidatus Omnitrophica bacterium]|nr:UDP-N-acetylglucosamine--N-acetylmuramyl-(pentapeptide) pyrophosphoryl-undecaprenol N-acetylglucosamine transferase [Candidatus Omnitrophota bacterium]
MKCVMATGGSGGHIFPAIEVAKVLRQAGHEVIFAGTFRHFHHQIAREGFVLYEFETKPFSIKAWNGFCEFSRSLSKSFFSSLKLLKEIQPDVVIGFGGYGSFPIVVSGILLNFPTMIHEQNVIPGRANRILAPGVKRIAISFEETQKYFPAQKTVWTGCPCRLANTQLNRSSILKEFGLSEHKKTILVLGGSQGSQRINQAFMDVSYLLKDEIPLQVIHLSGERD